MDRCAIEGCLWPMQVPAVRPWWGRRMTAHRGFCVRHAEQRGRLRYRLLMTTNEDYRGVIARDLWGYAGADGLLSIYQVFRELMPALKRHQRLILIDARTGRELDRQVGRRGPPGKVRWNV